MSKLERDTRAISGQDRLRVINTFAIDITSISNQSDLAWYVVREVLGNLGFEDCVVYFHDSDESALRQVAAIGPKNPFHDIIVNPLIIPVGTGITGTVAETREAVLENNLADNELYIPDIDAALSELCVPLKVGDKIYGVIDCEHPEVNHFTIEDQEYLTAIASLTSARLHLIEQSDHLQMIQELRLGEERFRDFVDVASDWYWELDENLRYSYIAAKSEEAQVYTKTYYLGKMRSEVKPDDMALETWQAHLDDLEARRPFRDFVQSRPTKDGGHLWQSLTGKPWFDARGKFMGYRAITTDITRHYVAE